jgi:hypothetical protein
VTGGKLKAATNMASVFNSFVVTVTEKFIINK